VSAAKIKVWVSPLGPPSELQSYTLNAQLLPGSDFANSIPPFVVGVILVPSYFRATI
jgi:hypothetical protein